MRSRAARTRAEPATRGDFSPDVAAVLAYHRLSGLAPDRPGAVPQRLDPRAQPIPFRRYSGAPVLALALAGDAEPAPSSIRTRLAEIARLLAGSLALTGWKRADRAGFGLRAVPSAGNLHPTESYLLAEGLEQPAAGEAARPALYHYSPFDHALERRRLIPTAVWRTLRTGCPEASTFLALSTIYWRCAWKYGERAFRLCHLDAGHAVAALDASAALAGQRVRWVDAGDAELERLLALDGRSGPESESAVCLLALERRTAPVGPAFWRPGPAALATLDGERPRGEPSRISRHHRGWPGLAEAVRATRRRGAGGRSWQPSAVPAVPDPPLSSREVLHRRRSRSLYLDRPLGLAAFAAVVGRTLGAGAAGCFPGHRDLAALLFVHRVEGLGQGLYAAAGDGAATASLRSALRRDLDWRPVPGVGEGWRLLALSSGDARRAASLLAGGQPAAGDGAFTVVVLARFLSLLKAEGAFAYRRLHWLAGELGHRCYLAAEAWGLGATGLGGFYDESLANLLGLTGDAWRPLYLLAVGHRAGPDPPLEPPYSHRCLRAEPVPPSCGGWREKPPATG